MTIKICAVIPAYNASKSIKQIVRGVLRYIPVVFVADDGSTDDTAQCALDAGAEVITIKTNRGKGYALKLLFHKAMDKGYDAVISLDADGQHDPNEIPHFIKAYNKHPEDIIIGSRMNEESNIPKARYTSMCIARFFISLAANQFIEDTQCGYRLYPLSLFRTIDLTTNKYVMETEILMKAGDMGKKIKTIQIRALYGKSVSHFRPIIDMTTITAYVISYITVKWTIESVSLNRPFTYSENHIRDYISKFKKLDIFFQGVTALMALPFSLLCLIVYIFFAPIVHDNFASVRCLGKGFHKITIATHMLPVTLMAAIIERICKRIGFNVVIIDHFLEKSYPNLWQHNQGGRNT